MTAPPLLSDADLRWRLAGPGGVPEDSDDPRLPVWEAAGLVVRRDGRWRWQVRQPTTLTPEQRAYIADDVDFERRCCDV